tara:strand:+ start:521 stop:784 length:264 start_codon:yes stop_codon:yes gene_type:complete
MEVLSDKIMQENPNSEVDINVLVSLYNQRLSQLSNQNVLLEAKLQTLKQDFEEQNNALLQQLAELQGNEEAEIVTPVRNNLAAKRNG